MRNTQYTNWIMKRKLKNVKNESKKTVEPGIWCEN